MNGRRNPVLLATTIVAGRRESFRFQCRRIDAFDSILILGPLRVIFNDGTIALIVQIFCGNARIIESRGS